MKGEINKDFYCSTNFHSTDYLERCLLQRRKKINESGCTIHCQARHRKWPTPEQYKEEYGEEYEGHRPVWWKYADNNGIWRTKSYNAAIGVIRSNLRNGRGYPKILIVCACTPWDRPPADWRPE
jgi:hypothetical protein